MTGKGCEYCPAVKPCMVSKYRGSLCAAIRAEAGRFTDPDKDVPVTVADYIRAMSDFELMQFL